ncbi:DUF4102 domain-containing protein [Candidatus Methylospira mobilis]|uniref:DUF4102 domain-containing protein n=1 Tax=Candidatus Methylospira mobilis TaxID=1808979 RepID=A0A5Q0BKX9_9GAMM|nr:Arm DNA-binding domain-containing protein [Candidatus Methylospira mobilis]QFY42778.1 DUF4102 domain-containing protein [Candidatus Methylospira mobilis]
MDKKFSFTKPRLDALPFATAGERIIYQDTHKNASGLLLRVTVTAKTFFIRRFVNGQTERVTLGKFPSMTIEQARNDAAEKVSRIAGGESVATVKRAKREEMTLQELFDEYMVRRAAFNRRPEKAQKFFNLYLTPWAKRKASSVSHEDVTALHTRIGKNNGRPAANQALALLHVMYNE